MSTQDPATTVASEREGRCAPVPPQQPDADRGVYAISVAAELVGMGVQTLRLYESRGLLEPERTDGGTRRYSTNDISRLHRISQLLDAGLNLAGIAMVLDLELENAQLRAERQEPRWLVPAPIRRPRSRRTTSSKSGTASSRTRD